MAADWTYFDSRGKFTQVKIIINVFIGMSTDHMVNSKWEIAAFIGIANRGTDLQLSVVHTNNLAYQFGVISGLNQV